MSEAGFYKHDVSGIVVGPSLVSSWAMFAAWHNNYAPWPCLGWTWQDEGEHDAGFYHVDGTYKSGILPFENLPVCQVNVETREGGYGWSWFDTKAEAYAAFGVQLPPPAWMPNTEYALGDRATTDQMYVCTCAGTSDGEWSQGPRFGGQGALDGTCIWDAVYE